MVENYEKILSFIQSNSMFYSKTSEFHTAGKTKKVPLLMNFAKEIGMPETDESGGYIFFKNNLFLSLQYPQMVENYETILAFIESHTMFYNATNKYYMALRTKKLPVLMKFAKEIGMPETDESGGYIY